MSQHIDSIVYLEKDTYRPSWPDCQRQIAWRGLEELSSVEEDQGYLLYSKLGLGFNTKQTQKPLAFDWINEQRFFASQGPHLQGPLARALRSGKVPAVHILDTTCGSGKDLCFFLSMKLKVTACERHPLIYLLAYDAWVRARQVSPAIFGADKIALFFQDARMRPWDKTIDTIYTDPMYADDHSQKSRARQTMEIFHDLCGEDGDRQVLWDWALAQPVRKVILKRPLKASSYLHPTALFPGKSTRYDVYFLN